jgi:hypothetical protein
MPECLQGLFCTGALSGKCFPVGAQGSQGDREVRQVRTSCSECRDSSQEHSSQEHRRDDTRANDQGLIVAMRKLCLYPRAARSGNFAKFDQPRRRVSCVFPDTVWMPHVGENLMLLSAKKPAEIDLLFDGEVRRARSRASASYMSG